MKIPDPNNSIAALIDRAHEERNDRPRPHLGCSMLGHPCDRWLWLSFRWAVVERFPGRILRLFRRGHMEESTIVSDLRAIGIDIQSTGKSQARVHFGAHVSGSIDGIIYSGVPEAPKKKHLAEFKTSSKKAFDDTVKKGVKASKPVHYAQMQVYMYGKDIDRALYLVVCKDDDRIYTERVRLDKKEAERLIERGKRITLAERMPEPLSTDPSWFQCKFCPGHSFCFDTHMTERVNCRTCAHVTPLDDSTWHCARYDAGNIPVDHQHDGCACHVLHPDLVPWQRAESANEWEAVYIIDGREVCNGEGGSHTYESRELVSNLAACLSGDDGIEAIRNEMGGRLIG